MLAREQPRTPWTDVAFSASLKAHNLRTQNMFRIFIKRRLMDNKAPLEKELTCFASFLLHPPCRPFLNISGAQLSSITKNML